MSPVLRLLLAATFAGGVITALAQQGDPAGAFVGLAPDELEFRPMPGSPGSSFATLLGDPSKEGPYVMRYRVPAGQLVPPHYHDQDRHITVMAGTWAFGTGDSHDCSDTRPMPPGSYVFHPAGGVHFDGSCTDEPIEVQIIGMGPVETFWLDETP